MSHPHLRAATVCPICKGHKLRGVLVCGACNDDADQDDPRIDTAEAYWAGEAQAEREYIPEGTRPR